ncbi:hypothetical protein LCGC14_1530330 [marine sediment metagenome]|uniref:Uncharacterized protein n=1 Tax=marine sediment metagenome TaxID=412755 RepID=A0A0F9LWY2_9ZZZZ
MSGVLGSEYQKRLNFLMAQEQGAIDQRNKARTEAQRLRSERDKEMRGQNEARNEVARLLGALKQTRDELQIQRNEVIRLKAIIAKREASDIDDAVELQPVETWG